MAERVVEARGLRVLRHVQRGQEVDGAGAGGEQPYPRQAPQRQEALLEVRVRAGGDDEAKAMATQRTGNVCCTNMGLPKKLASWPVPANSASSKILCFFVKNWTQSRQPGGLPHTKRLQSFKRDGNFTFGFGH